MYVLNPYKYVALRKLLEDHRAKGDKILIFSENVAAIKRYGTALRCWFMHGGTPDQEREHLLRRFRMSGEEVDGSVTGPIQVLMLSRVGDVALDLPEANVILQISSHYGSRRQEAQRLGRILRPKPSARNSVVSLNAFFYSIVTLDTAEMTYSNKRRQYLVDQGYTYHAVQNLVPDWAAALERCMSREEVEEWLKEAKDPKAAASDKDVPVDQDGVDVEVAWDKLPVSVHAHPLAKVPGMAAAGAARAREVGRRVRS